MLVGAAGHKFFKKIRILCPEKPKADDPFQDDGIFIGFLPDPGGKPCSERGFWVDESRRNCLAFEGEIYNRDEILRLSGAETDAEALFRLYRKQGRHFLDRINGAFSLAVWDGMHQNLLIATDPMGIYQAFFRAESGGLAFSSRLFPMAEFQTGPGPAAAPLLEYLVFCYNIGEDTFYPGIKRLKQGHFLEWNDSGHSVCRYWKLDFDPDKGLSESKAIEAVRDALKESVRLRMRPSRKPAAFLSGGLDSSTVVSMLVRNGADDCRTFSFRCRGESFDESHYAELVSSTFRTQHQVVEYVPESVYEAGDMTRLMDEPFEDVGISIATYILSRAASETGADLFTGDGGDELFAGHPVYLADKGARLIGWIPDIFLDPVFALGRRLPDSERKNDWKVKIKRFSESYAFPKSLGTHRWRAYYLPSELGKLFNPDFARPLNLLAACASRIAVNEEAGSADPLGRSLYSDYQSAVQFYMRRMGMARSFGLKPRFPMLDPGLAALCASIPSGMKMPGFSDTKPLEKKVAGPFLPDAVVNRRDKLGHSIPMKNWIRDH
ncbi:hypothetical protein JW906_09320, partial [bacterium]|nr:hypothetical protein [bacterium]